MAYTLERLNDEPIVVLTQHESWDYRNPPTEPMREFAAILDDANAPLFLIVQISPVKLDVDGLMAGTQRVVMGPDALWRHPLIREILMVSAENFSMLKLAAQGYASERFGDLKVSVFETLNEALAYARSQM